MKWSIANKAQIKHFVVKKPLDKLIHKRAYYRHMLRKKASPIFGIIQLMATGGGNFDRPGWQQLLADIEAGIVKTVLVKDMSRVGRNYVETGFYTEVYFGRMGVRFIVINNDIDNNNPDSTEFACITESAGTGCPAKLSQLRKR